MKGILLKCPKGHTREVGVEFAGKRAVCDQCGHVWDVPAPSLGNSLVATSLALEPAEVRPPKRRWRRIAMTSREKRAGRGANERESERTKLGTGAGIVIAALIFVLGWIAYIEYNKWEARQAAREAVDNLQRTFGR